MANIYRGKKKVSYVRVKYILQGSMSNYVRVLRIGSRKPICGSPMDATNYVTLVSGQCPLYL